MTRIVLALSSFSSQTLLRKPTLAILLAIAGLSISTESFAQRPSQAQIGAIRSACQSDYPVHCAGVPAGGAAALQCLQKNVANVSPACQTAVNAAGQKSTPKQPTAAQKKTTTTESTPVVADPVAPAPAFRALTPRQELAVLRSACGPDFRQLCADVPLGRGRAISCLRENAASLSPQCGGALMSARRR